MKLVSAERWNRRIHVDLPPCASSDVSTCDIAKLTEADQPISTNAGLFMGQQWLRSFARYVCRMNLSHRSQNSPLMTTCFHAGHTPTHTQDRACGLEEEISEYVYGVIHSVCHSVRTAGKNMRAL